MGHPIFLALKLWIWRISLQNLTKIYFFYEIKYIKKFYVLVFYSIESLVEAISLKNKEIETLKQTKICKNVMVVSKRVKSMSKRVKSTF